MATGEEVLHLGTAKCPSF